jgi:DNA-binding NarL/FixJ family response regulator
MKIRVLIADEHALINETVAFWLTEHAEVQVVGLAQNGRIAVNLACELQPDVVLMDIAMPSLNGIEATQEIARRAPGTRILILSDEVDSRSVRDAIDAGACGYLSKHCSTEELIQAIRSVFEDGTYLSPAASSIVVHEYVHGGIAAAPSQWLSLTSRERQVLQLIVEGHNTKAIANILSLSPKTIDWHRIRMMRKLGLDSIAGLVRFALAEGTPLGVPSLSGLS